MNKKLILAGLLLALGNICLGSAAPAPTLKTTAQIDRINNGQTMQQVATALEAGLSDDDSRKELINKIQSNSQKTVLNCFSMENTLIQYQELYQSLLKQ